jgi:SIR2-like domain
MLDGDERQNFYALKRLRDIVVEGSRPIVFWIGGGASKWCGYASWKELAEYLHSVFSSRQYRYDKADAGRLLSSGDLPGVFSICRNADLAMYHRALASSLGPRPATPVYDNFVQLLTSFRPLYVLTTNIDEALEQRISSAAIIQRSDFERCISMLQQKKSFICKLHGSISSIEQTVFTREDYLDLERNPAYISLLRHVFAEASIVFLGYGLRDEYVLKMLGALEPQSRIFGNGPHFFITASAPPDLPPSIIPIKYFVGMSADHRSAIMALDIIRASQEGKLSGIPTIDVTSNTADLLSGYYISDFAPAGTWTTSQTLQLSRPGGSSFFAVVGHGFVNSELKNFEPHSPRDFVVGLLCFDTVYLPLSSLAVLHDYLGEGYFWRLISEDVLRFVQISAQPGYIYESAESQTSVDVGLVGLSGKEGTFLTVRENIRRQIKAAPGKESAAEALFVDLEAKVITFDIQSWEIPRLVRGALLHPRLRRLLGFSDGIFPTAIPRWLVFPALRVAHTVNTAALCQQFNLAAANIWFGGEILVGATFGLTSARDWAHEVASYVMTSQADVDIGSVADASVLETILKFRNTSEGIRLRREVLEQLRVNAGSEFISSVNAGLKRNIPFSALDKPRRVFAALVAAESGDSQLTRAVSYNPLYSDGGISLWRARSLEQLKELCKSRGIGPYDQCPCGSGEKLKFCCFGALRSAD